MAENIDFLKTRDRKRLDSAVKRCCLDEFISTLPRKIDTLVDEEQRQLSGGQKARIGLARAIYAAPDVLLVDEATSALDADTALKIEKMLVSLKGTLLIHISHKPAPELMQEYDAILTMDAGRIISVRTKGCAEKDKNAFT